MSVKTEKPSLAIRIDDLVKMKKVDYVLQKKQTATDYDITVKDVEDLVREASGDDGTGSDGDGQSDIAVTLALKTDINLFHDDSDAAFAEYIVDGHKEVWPLETKQFRKWFSSLFWTEQKRALREQARKDAVSTLAGIAENDGDEHCVHIRTAFNDGRYYIDLCDDSWRVVEVDSQGWRILDRSPVKFRRTSNMFPLPEPSENGSLSGFWKIVNVSKEDRAYVLTWIIDALRSDTQYPVLEIIGGHGSAKSTLQRFIRGLIDPNRVDLRAAPKREEDIWTACNNNLVISYENLSNLSHKAQDALCTISTGGGHASREFYTNYDEAVIEANNPIILNGINPVVTAADLSDRTVRIYLQRIEDNTRLEHGVIDSKYERDKGDFFGGILTIFSKALAVIDGIHLEVLPRMASYSLLGEAICQSQGSKFQFNKNYMASRRKLLVESTESSPAIQALLTFLKARKDPYEGNYETLFGYLSDVYKRPGESWPTSAKGLSNLINIHTPGLEVCGVTVEKVDERKMDGYHVLLTYEEPKTEESVAFLRPQTSTSSTQVHEATRVIDVHEHMNVMNIDADVEIL